MSVKIETIIAFLAIAVPVVCAIIGAAWMVAQGLGALGQRVQAIEEICREGFKLAEDRTAAARGECEQKIVAVHGRVNGVEAAHNTLVGRVVHLESEHGLMMQACARHAGKGLNDEQNARPGVGDPAGGAADGGAAGAADAAGRVQPHDRITQ